MRNKISKWIGVTNTKRPLPMPEQPIVGMKMLILCSIQVLLDTMISKFEHIESVFVFIRSIHSFSQSTPESWAQNSHDNIVNGQNQLMASIQLRSLIDSILVDTARVMREKADVVETEFGKRIAEVSDALQKMTYNMREV